MTGRFNRTFTAGHLTVTVERKASGNLHVNIMGQRASGKTALRTKLAAQALKDGWRVNATDAPKSQNPAGVTVEFLILFNPEKHWTDFSRTLNRAAKDMAGLELQP